MLDTSVPERPFTELHIMVFLGCKGVKWPSRPI